MFQLYRLQDIQIADVDLKAQYYSLFLDGNIDGARLLAEANEQLNSKVISKDNLNRLVDAILGLEGYYDDGVTQYLDGLTNEYQVSIDDLIYMTLYNALLQYEINNVVMYNDELYYCYAKPPIGTLPTNTSYWLYLGLKGDNGNPSLGVDYKGAWSSSVTYSEYDMVVYQSRIYVAKTSNINKIPKDNPTEWFLAMDVMKQGIYISTSGATGLSKGDLWLYIINYLFSDSTSTQTITIDGVDPLLTDIGDIWLDIDGYNNTTPSGIYVSETEPTTLATNDIWIKIEGYSLHNSSLYIAQKYPQGLEVGALWIEILG